MSREVNAAMHEASLLKWWPSREQTRQVEQLAERRRERAARARRQAKGNTQ